MILCKIDIEENSQCKRCCKDCKIFKNKEYCKAESVCIFAKRHMECDHQIIKKGEI